jgi:hypothetical protein
MLRQWLRADRWLVRPAQSAAFGESKAFAWDASLAERYHNVTSWAEHPIGGHFPAVAEPELLVRSRVTRFAPCDIPRGHGLTSRKSNKFYSYSAILLDPPAVLLGNAYASKGQTNGCWRFACIPTGDSIDDTPAAARGTRWPCEPSPPGRDRGLPRSRPGGLSARTPSSARPWRARPAQHRALALQWYDITDQTVSAAAFPEPATQSRVWSLAWLAAARAVEHGHNPSYAAAAFAQALHDALLAQVPAQQPQLDRALATTLAAIPDGAAKNAGITEGQHEAALALLQRQGDGLDTASLDIPFTPPPPGPGVWQPTPPTFAPAVRAGQGNARPFLPDAADQFDPGPPPSLNSPTYLRSLAEVRAYGSATSAVRTPGPAATAASPAPPNRFSPRSWAHTRRLRSA